MSDKPDNAGNWSRVSVLISSLNPILLLVIGFYLNQGIQGAKLQIEENSAHLSDLKTAAEASAITTQTRMDKVKVISDFINDLTGPNEHRRQLAIEAIVIALPDEAARLLKTVASFNVSGGLVTEKDVAAANSVLDSTRASLIVDMFSVDRATRIEALRTLERGWTDDKALTIMLLDRAMRDVQARSGAGWAKPNTPESNQQLASIYNTVQFLSVAHPPGDAALRTKITDFLNAAAPNSDDTSRLVAATLERLK